MARQSAATGAGMRYRQFAALPGPEQTRHMEALEWEGRFLLTFEALLEMECKYETLRVDLKAARAQRVELRRGIAALTQDSSMHKDRVRRNREIRAAAHEKHMTVRDIALQFGVSHSQVRTILRGPGAVEMELERMKGILQ